MNQKIPEVEVRAYDLGGFGDIAGALRVASFLKLTGHNVAMKTASESARKKLELLKTDLPVLESLSARIRVDVAGHYKDDRNRDNRDVPHHYSEDMDNSQNRENVVPLYLKTGLVPVSTQLPEVFKLSQHNPLFYRPLMEHLLPKPSERDVRNMILELYRRKIKLNGLDTSLVPIEKVLANADKIGFAHTAPCDSQESVNRFFNHSYINALTRATISSEQTYALGLFVNEETEFLLATEALKRNWNIIFGDGNVTTRNTNKYLVFLGGQPQMTTTSLFLSSNMPNLVTGDLSLSDALYGVIAMNGPPFYYDCPSWKAPTFEELAGIFNRQVLGLGNIFALGSVHINPEFCREHERLVNMMLDETVSSFMREGSYENYRERMKEALTKEITARFGTSSGLIGIDPSNPTNGFYVPEGSPFLIQDATEYIVRLLLENTWLFNQTEITRRRIAGEPIISINVVEAAPQKPDAEQKLGKKEKFTDYSLEQLLQSPNYLDYNLKKKYLKSDLETYINDDYKMNHYKKSLDSIYSLDKIIKEDLNDFSKYKKDNKMFDKYSNIKKSYYYKEEPKDYFS